MMGKGASATAVFIGAAIIVAQVILPATFDLIGSVGLLAVGAYAGWQAKSKA